MRAAALLSSLIFATSAYTAGAHTRWDPNGPTPPRTPNDDIKTGPCGAPRGANPAVFEPGAELEVAFESTIYHQGEFRIAFSPAADQGFDEHVLAEGIADVRGQRYRTHRITLPAVTCEDCTLQLIQSMPDRTPTTYYYSCADIALRAAAAPVAVAEVNASASADGDGVWLRWDAGREALWVMATVAVDFTATGGAQYAEGDPVGNGEVLHLGDSGAMRVALPPGIYHFKAFGVGEDLGYSAGQTLGPVDLAEAAAPPPATSTGGVPAWLAWLLAAGPLLALARQGRGSRPLD